MNATPRYRSLRDYLEVIRRRRVAVLLCMVLGAGAALAVSVQADPVYESETSLSFNEPGAGAELIGVVQGRVTSPEQRAAQGAALVNDPRLAETVQKELRLPGEIDVQGQAELRTNLVVVTVKAGSPELAARIASKVADEVLDRTERAQSDRYNDLIRAAERRYRSALEGDDVLAEVRRREFEEQLAKLRATRDFSEPVNITRAATASSSPISPKPVRNTALGAAMGLLLGLGVAFFLAAVDRRLRNVSDVLEEAPLPLLGTVREESLGQLHTGVGSPEAETDFEPFRILRTNLEYLRPDGPPKVVLVTSPLPEEGKSTVASSLAAAYTAAGRRTLLVDGDFRRPVVASRLGVEATPGLVDYLLGSAGPSEVVRSVVLGGDDKSEGGNGATAASPARPPLAVIPAGRPREHMVDLFGSGRFAGFLDEVRSVFDHIVIDSPPMLSVGDALDLVHHVDAVVLCVRADQTTRDQTRAAVEALSRLPERPSGIVVTGTTAMSAGDYGYYEYAYAYARSTS